ncbi:MAG: hypothetical protein QOC60_1860, partial [Frankiaceae bacterium]|nr:hypothetical protein [Frankiaceae bacterium]
MSLSTRFRVAVSAVTAVAMMGTGLAFAPAASATATPAETAAANAFRDAIGGTGGAASFLDGLTSVGAFATAEPALTLVPNSPAALGSTPLADALGKL